MFTHHTLSHIGQRLVSCWTEIAETTALCKSRGHISTPNTPVSDINCGSKEAVFEGHVLKEEGRRMGREGRKPNQIQRSKASRIQPESAHKESAFWLSTLKEGLN